MPDLSKHLMQNWEWCQAYRSQMGKEAYNQYVGNVYTLLLNMQPDTYFSIEKNVKPANIDLFVKVCCMFIQEQFMSDRPRNFCHSFSPDYTEIRCVPIL
jgi:hypothetical protein